MEIPATSSVRIKVVLVDLPRMLHDIIAGVVDAQPDMELVPDELTADLPTRVRERGANIVIARLVNDRLPRDCEELLWTCSPLAVLGIAERSGRAVLYRLRPQAVELGEVSPEELLMATRAAARSPLAERG